MADIVERLRELAAYVTAPEVCDEAAEEIERLRADNKRMAGDEVKRILRDADEIERLRHEVRRLEDALETRSALSCPSTTDTE